MDPSSYFHTLWFLALRQLRAKKTGGLGFMTTISILGVAIGVGALVIVLSVMGGFEEDLREKMFRGLPHLEILAENEAQGFSLKEKPLKYFEELYPDSIGMEPFVQSDVVIKKGKNLNSVTLFGIDPQLGGALWGFSEGLINESLNDLLKPTGKNSNPIILGESLATTMGLDIGDEIIILNPQTRADDLLAGSTLSTRFKIAGLFSTDLPHYDAKYVVTTLSEGRKFLPDYDPSLSAREFVTGIAMNLKDPGKVNIFEERLPKDSGLKTLSWKQVNKSLLFALKLEKFTMGAILLLIVLVAAFSICGTMMMTVFHRHHQLALIRALGLSRKNLAFLYILQGFLIGAIGSILGLIFGLAFCLLFYNLKHLDYPTALYLHRHLPVKFLPLEYTIIAGSSLLLSVLASLYPAFLAAKQSPSHGLRYR